MVKILKEELRSQLLDFGKREVSSDPSVEILRDFEYVDTLLLWEPLSCLAIQGMSREASLRRETLWKHKTSLKRETWWMCETPLKRETSWEHWWLEELSWVFALILWLIVFCRRIDICLRVFFLETNKLVRTRGDVSSEVGDVVWLIILHSCTHRRLIHGVITGPRWIPKWS